VRVDGDGISLWYRTADAPAPSDRIDPGVEVAVTIGVHPVDVRYEVTLTYRANDGPAQHLAAQWLWNEPGGGAQYFRAILPAFDPGDTVEYMPTCRRAGIDVPAAGDAAGFASRLRVSEMPRAIVGTPPEPAPPDPALVIQRKPTHNGSGIVYSFDKQGVGERKGGAGEGSTLTIDSPVDELKAPLREGDSASGDDTEGLEQPRELGGLNRSELGSVEVPATFVEGRRTMEMLAKRPSPTLEGLATALHLEFPGALLPKLAEHGIRTLADIQIAGGLSQVAGLSPSARDSAVRLLEAHADLSALSPDVELNAALIEQGFTSIPAIAATPQADFVAAAGGRLDDLTAVQLHVMARAQTNLLNSVLTGLRQGQVGLTGDGRPSEALLDLLASKCGCEDCQSATGPSAYLTDLADYAQKHLKSSQGTVQTSVGLDALSRILHQPFGDLQISCGSSAKPVRQVRICVEVLRSLLRATIAADADLDCSASPFEPRFAISGDVDGDGRDELVVYPQLWDLATTLPVVGSTFWVMDFDPEMNRWRHLSPQPNDPFDSDFDCSKQAVAVKFAVAADVNGDGRDEIVIAADRPGAEGNDFWVMAYSPKVGKWHHLSPVVGHSFGADFQCTTQDVVAKFAVAADVDGDGRAEIVIGVDRPGAEGNDFWVMDYNPFTNQWQHLSPIGGHPFEADFACRTSPPPAKFALAGDVDGDGRDEIVIAIGTPADRNFWVMDYDIGTKQWQHLSPVAGGNWDEDIAPSLSPYTTTLAALADVDGNGRAELVIGPQAFPGAVADPNALWVLGFDPVNRTWNSVAPIPGHPLGASIDCSAKPIAAGQVVIGDVDGDGRDDIVVVPVPGSHPNANGFWVMHYTSGLKQWQHLSPIGGHPLDADLDWNALVWPATFALTADVDGDGRAEVIIGSGRNEFWVMTFDTAASIWHHLSPITASAEKGYLLAAYTSLLTAIGTSYDEIRLARSAPIDARRSLAERIGIDLDPSGTRPDHLDAFLLQPTAVTEPALEQLFGLVDTTRDPLSEGAKLGDSKNQVTRWNLDGVAWGTNPWASNTDPDGTVYLTLTRLPPSGVSVAVFRDRLRTNPVASGEASTAKGTVSLSPLNDSGLSGNLEIAYTTDSDTIELSVVPKLLSWRGQHLRTQWKVQDWPANPFTDGSLPGIDPDVIGADDFRAPFRKASPTDPDTAFDLWVRRRRWVDKRIKSLSGKAKMVNGQIMPDLDGMLNSMAVPIAYENFPLRAPWSRVPLANEFEDLIETLTLGGDHDARRSAKAVVQDELNLTVESFGRLMAIRAKNLRAEIDSGNENVTMDDWAEVWSILAQAQKHAFYDGPSAPWKVEETNSHVVPGPEEFWLPAREPAGGEWPPNLPPGHPLIDPEAVNVQDLPERTAGARAIALWKIRRARLDQITKSLRGTHEAAGFEALLQAALGQLPAGATWQQELRILEDERNSGDATRVSSAEAKIAADLAMTVEDFGRLMGAKDKLDHSNQPTPAEWSGIYDILTTSRKVMKEFPGWLAEEQDPATGVSYWSGLKARLPSWRTSAEARLAWRRSLLLAMQPPAIDPDVVARADLRSPVMGDPAFEIWRSRRAWLETVMSGLDASRSASTTPLAGFDAVVAQSLFGNETAKRFKAQLKAIREQAGLTAALKSALGDPLPDLDKLRADILGTGTSAEQARQAVASSLYLASEKFQRLMVIRAKDTSPGSVTVAEWEEAYAILTQASLVRSLMSLASDDQRGVSIGPHLDQLAMTRDAFTVLIRIRRLLVSSAPILNSEWDDVYSILAQAEKRRLFGKWRNEEKAHVLLSPDYFSSLAASASPGSGRTPMPAWRASQQVRRQWQDGLRSREDQDKAVAQALHTAVETAEESTLTLLRDALLNITDPAPANLQEKAKRFSEHTLIDSQTSGCQVTNRVDQATETLQTLLNSVRAGQMSNSYPMLVLAAPEFDRQWQWLGTYDAWRAAKSVFAFPEDVLFPSLRPRQTAAFKKLVQDLREMPHLRREQACEFARAYADYFADVCSLQVDACVEASTPINVMSTEGCSARATDQRRDLVYFFARSGLSRKTYWSAQDVQSASSSPLDTLWNEVPGFNPAISLVGAAVYTPPSGDSHIYLFGVLEEHALQRLVFNRYDIETGRWLGEPVSIDSPGDLTGHSPWLMTTTLGQPPRVGIQPPNGGVSYFRGLNRDGTAWSGDFRPIDWLPLGANSRAGVQIPFIAVGENADGRLEVFYNENIVGGVASFQGASWHNWQTAPDGPWSGWQVFGYLPWHPQVARNHDGRLEILGRAMQNWQTTPGGSWSGWQSLSPGPLTTSGDVGVEVVNENADGRLETFFTDGSENVWHNWQTSSGSAAWAGWQMLGDPADKGTKPVVARNADGRLEAFLVGTAHDLWHNWQISPGSAAWSGWQQLGDFKGASSLAVARNADGRLEAFAIGTDHAFWHAWQVIPGGAWSAWQRLSPPEYLGLTVKAQPGKDGRLHAFAVTADNRLLHNWQTAPGGTWAGWQMLGNPDARGSTLEVQRRIDGHLTVFMVDTANDLWYIDLPEPQPRVACSNPGNIPRYGGPFDISERLTGTQLQGLRQAIRDALTTNSSQQRFYLEEAWYFAPIQLALQLQKAGDYTAALDWFRTVYDYSQAPYLRKIYYGLVWDAALPSTPAGALDWLIDPMNPFAIAATRSGCLTRFTLTSLVRCFLDFADTEFARDTSDSVVHARALYNAALELLDVPELVEPGRVCDEPTSHLTTLLADAAARPEISQTEGQFTQLAETATIHPVASRQPTLADRMAAREDLLNTAHLVLLTHPSFGQAFVMVADRAAQGLRDSRSGMHAARVSALDKEVDAPAELEATASGIVDDHGAGLLGTNVPLGPSQLGATYSPSLPYPFCIPPNPLVRTLRLHAELSLQKIRSCLNMAGLRRQLDPHMSADTAEGGVPSAGFAAQVGLLNTTIFAPTPYRYAALMERAKHLAQLASQVEDRMLSALEKLDAETYSLLKSRQDVRLAYANVQLQELRVAEAAAGVTQANLQHRRAQVEVDHYKELSNQEDNSSDMLGLFAKTALGVVGVVATAATGGAAAGPIAIASALFSQASGAVSQSNSLESQRENWAFQQAQAQQDVGIAEEQIAIAQGRVLAISQDKIIAEMAAANTEVVASFLANKFTNADLYDWMSRILQGIYRFFLQQATATAQLAAKQLAFERHEAPPPFIQSDYWEVVPASATASAPTAATDGTSVDRRGLTGSARLQQDIYELDQYAFATDRRKLELTKTVSLGQLSPIEFQRFRETGVMSISTSMEVFDRDFPGHYLRLIKRVRVSVVALIPPAQGIHATLTSSGTSRVIIGGDTFHTVIVRRDPEAVALTSPREATGLFDLQQQPEMLLPFEGLGVDMMWELRMPRAVNLFDFGTIADVLFTLDYTALDSSQYRAQVLQRLNSTLSLDRAFSFRNEFVDQWYDLHNPDQTDTPMVVRFVTVREDFPPNVRDLTIQHITLYFARAPGQVFELPATQLCFTPAGGSGTIRGAATSVDGVISTRTGSAGNWLGMIGLNPAGTWELALQDIEEIRNRFQDEQIQDMVLAVTYSGRTPEWPS
jgi:hypothetical protein